MSSAVEIVPAPIVASALSIDDASRTLGIRRDTTYKLAREGRLRLVKLGSRTVVPVSEIARLLAPPSPENVAA